MDLCFDKEKAERYKSPSQIARVLTEDWAAKHLFCVACNRNRLQLARDNTKVSEKKYDVRGWTADVLKIIRELGKTEFALNEVYAYDEQLQKLHPENKHIRPKIRQQLQILRDKGILKFIGHGKYQFK